MRRYLKLPLWFFFIAGCIGLLLRWHFIAPIPGLIYPYWLHAHSHIMFLGWVFNSLYLAYVLEFIPEEKHKRYTVLFVIMQFLLVGMLISFPIQGYGVVSIIVSTLHTVSVGVFCAWFFRDTRGIEKTISLMYVRMSLIFFLVSAVGPFSLGPLMANGLGQSHWYYFAIYFYLHFQYNGVFVSGVLGLFYRMIEQKGIVLNPIEGKRSGTFLFIGTILSYALSVLWAQPHYVFNLIGLVGDLLQVVSLFWFVKSINPIFGSGTGLFSSPALWLMRLAAVAFVLKTFLQVISAHPSVAQLAYEVRPFVIAYLHLVVIGVVTFFLIAWYLEKNVIQLNFRMIILFVSGFIGSELILIFSYSFVHIAVNISVRLLFIFSLLMVAAIAGFLIPADRK